MRRKRVPPLSPQKQTFNDAKEHYESLIKLFKYCVTFCGFIFTAGAAFISWLTFKDSSELRKYMESQVEEARKDATASAEREIHKIFREDNLEKYVDDEIKKIIDPEIQKQIELSFQKTIDDAIIDIQSANSDEQNRGISILQMYDYRVWSDQQISEIIEAAKNNEAQSWFVSRLIIILSPQRSDKISEYFKGLVKRTQIDLYKSENKTNLSLNGNRNEALNYLTKPSTKQDFTFYADYT